MSSYKLIYYNYRSRAEAIRMLLAYGGLKYEDVRIDDGQWKDMKPSEWKKLI
jgi:glutathione S-transferase